MRLWRTPLGGAIVLGLLLPVACGGGDGKDSAQGEAAKQAQTTLENAGGSSKESKQTTVNGCDVVTKGDATPLLGGEPTQDRLTSAAGLEADCVWNFDPDRSLTFGLWGGEQYYSEEVASSPPAVGEVDFRKLSDLGEKAYVAAKSAQGALRRVDVGFVLNGKTIDLGLSDSGFPGGLDAASTDNLIALAKKVAAALD